MACRPSQLSAFRGSITRPTGCPCERFAPWVTQAHASLGSGCAADLGRMGLDTHRVRFEQGFEARSHHGILSPLTGLSRHTRWCITGWWPAVVPTRRSGILSTRFPKPPTGASQAVACGIRVADPTHLAELSRSTPRPDITASRRRRSPTGSPHGCWQRQNRCPNEKRCRHLAHGSRRATSLRTLLDHGQASLIVYVQAVSCAEEPAGNLGNLPNLPLLQLIARPKSQMAGALPWSRVAQHSRDRIYGRDRGLPDPRQPNDACHTHRRFIPALPSSLDREEPHDRYGNRDHPYHL